MSNNEITVVSSTVSNVASAFSDFFTCISLGSSMRKQNAVKLKYALQRLEAETRIRDLSDLTRTSITEINRTVDDLASKPIDDYTFMRVELLKIQEAGLMEILNRYMHGY